MSLRNWIGLFIVLSALAVLAACGSGNSVTVPVAPPSGGFSKSNLNGTYVFSVSGTDVNGAPYAMVGTLNANGSGGITGGTLDLNDAAFASSSPVVSPAANVSITSSSSYSVGVDGRGQAKLVATTPFGSSIMLDFVLQDSSHGLVTEFDNNGSGSGTMDLQAAGTTPTGSYAFLFSGVYNSVPLSTAGNFTLGNGGAMSGLEDLNSDGIPLADETLSGTFSLGPSSTPATVISAIPSSGTANYSITYDAFAIDGGHLKFIEMDSFGTLSGDAFAQSSTTMPTGTLAFSLIGSIGTTSPTVTAAGGFMITDGNGNITSNSTEDINSSNGTLSSEPVGFSGTYAPGGTGRYTLGNFSGFVGATEFAAYPSTGGVLFLELDSGGLMAGAAYLQTTGSTVDTSQGYGLNLSGVNLSQSVEVDDIAEFATASSGLTLTGVTDENYAPGAAPNYGLALSGSYTTPDSNGRGQVTASAGNSSNGTLNGGFGITYYAVDGTTFPFIEMDTTQITAGVFVKQNSSSSSSAATRSHMYVLPAVVRPRIARKLK